MHMCDTYVQIELSGRSPAKDTSKEVGEKSRKRAENM